MRGSKESRRAPQGRWKRWTAAGARLTQIVFAALLWLDAPALAAPAPEVHILSTGLLPHRALIQSIEAALYVSPEPPVTLKTHTLTADGRAPPGFGAGPPALTLTVGTRAAEAVLQDGKPGAPLVAVMIPQVNYSTLTAGKVMGQPVSAFYLDQPAARQFALARLVLPRARRIGTLLGPLSGVLAPDLGAAAQRAGIEFTAIPVPSEDALPAALRALAKDRDAYLAAYAPDVITSVTAKWLLYSGYEHGLPVLGYSQGFVEAGAIAAVFSEPGQLGRQVGQWLRGWLAAGSASGKGAPLPAPQFPDQFSVAVNRHVAYNLNLAVPDTLSLEHALRAAEASTPVVAPAPIPQKTP